MTSSSSGGTSVIVLQFNLSLNIDIAEEEVQSAINASQNFLPANLPSPPIYSKTNPADAPVITLAVTSSSIPLSQVEDLVDTRLAPKISQLSGVGLVTISGGQKPAVQMCIRDRAAFVYVIQDNTAHMRAVKTGVTDGGTAQVTGINPGDVLANRSFDKLQDNSKVVISNKPVPASTQGSSAP